MGKVYQRDIADACEEYSKIFGANKNLYRIIPSFQDGLKPSARRFLYTLYRGKGREKFIKMAKAAGDTTAAFHPHGNAAVEDVGAKLASPIQNNIPVVQGQGNFGSYKTEKAGASRYIECRLSRYAMKCFFEDFESSNVDMRESYTGDDMEPEYLPARYPHALFNPQLSGIGYAMSSNICPFNPTEVMEATIKLIKNPKAKIMLVPDSPTGADIVDDGQFEAINKDGIGTFTLKGTIEVDEINNILTITSIPLQITIDEIIRNIALLKEKKQFEEIISIKDYTKNKTGVRTVIQLAKTANPYKTIENLYKKNTGLKKTYPVGIKLIDDYKDYDYGVISFLKEWIEYRRDCVRSTYNTKLVKAMEEQNINDVKIFATEGDRGAKNAQISRESADSKEAIQTFMKVYGIDSQKAAVIDNMKNSELNKEHYQKYVERKQELIDKIAEYESILDNDEKIDEIIIAQLKEGIKLFGSPRKSNIVKENGANEYIEDSYHIIGISNDGYIKKVDLEKGQIGQVGSKPGQYMSFKANNRDCLWLFDSTGYISRILVNDIADMDLSDNGIVLERFSPVHGKVVASLIEFTPSELKKLGKNVFFTFLTKQGYMKRTNLDEFQNINGSKLAIKLQKDDELVAVDFTLENSANDIVIYTNLGNGIRINIESLSTMKPNARGVSQLKLGENEYCVGFDKINPDKKYMFYITSAGKVKITDLKYFPTGKKKNDEILSLITLDKTDSLVGIHTVSKDDKIRVFKKNSKPEDINISDLSVSTRIAKADKVVKVSKGDSVLAYSVITK